MNQHRPVSKSIARPAEGSFSSRLRKLRRRLVASSLLAVLLSVGLLATVVTLLEAQSRREQIVAELDRRTTAARSLIYYNENGDIQVDGLLDDEAINERPHVFAVEQYDGVEAVVFAPDRPDFELDYVAVSDQTVEAADRIEFETTDPNGLDVLVVSRPFYHDETDEIAGSVTATATPSSSSPASSRLLLTVWVGSALLAAALAFGSRVLIDRSLAPAAAALVEHERFVADAAHEIRHPLAALRATAEYGLSADEPEPALKRSIEILDYTTKMMEDLLALSRLDGSGGELSMEPLRLDQLVETIADRFPDTEMTYSEASKVTADARLVRQAVVNLLTNALQHGSPPVEVQVRGTTVSVSDHGPGFDDDIAAATGRFHSGSTSTGAGLGLALADAVAQAHGGHLKVQNNETGSSVELTL